MCKCNVVRSEFIILFRSSGPWTTRLPGEDRRAIPGSRATWRATNYMRFEGVVHEGAGRSRPEPVVRSNPFSPQNNNYCNLLTRRPIRPVLVLFSYTHTYYYTYIIMLLYVSDSWLSSSFQRIYVRVYYTQIVAVYINEKFSPPSPLESYRCSGLLRFRARGPSSRTDRERDAVHS